jgi:hypothetical protein
MASLTQRTAELNAALLARVAEYADLLAEYFDTAGAALADMRAYRIPQALPGRLQVPPPLLPARAATQLGRRHAAFRAGLTEIFRYRMGGQWERLADGLRLSDAARPYLGRNRQPRWSAIARPDCVLDGDTIAMVEPNGGSSIGGMPDTDVLGRVFAASPVIGDFLRNAGAIRPRIMRRVADVLRLELARAGRYTDGLVLVSDLRAYLAKEEPGHAELLAAELRRYGIRAQTGAVEDVDCGPRSVTWQGRRVDLIYRFWAEQPDSKRQFPLLDPLLRAARSGLVVLFDDLDDQIATSKAALVLVSEELDAGNLTAELARELSPLVPWSRFVADGAATVAGTRVDLLPWCATNQRSLVLKPCHGYAGRGVTIGREVTSAQWARALSDAIASDEAWMVQALVAGEPERIGTVRDGTIASEQTYVSYGYFAVGDQVAGMIRRSAPAGRPSRLVIHSAHGPVFFVQLGGERHAPLLLIPVMIGGDRCHLPAPIPCLA